MMRSTRKKVDQILAELAATRLEDVEEDPAYCDFIRKRWENFQKKTAGGKVTSNVGVVYTALVFEGQSKAA